MQYINLPDKLNQPTPRGITGKEDFMEMSRVMFLYRLLPFPVIGVGVIIVAAVVKPEMLFAMSIMGGAIILLGVLLRYLFLKTSRIVIHLLDKGIMTNGALINIGRPDRLGQRYFELSYKDRSGNTYYGKIVIAYFNSRKYQLSKGTSIPVFYNENDPKEFSIYLADCGLGTADAKKI